MATEVKVLDAVISSSGLSNATVANLNTEDANWATATSNNVATNARVSFPTPTGNPNAGANLQTITFQTKKQGGTGTPTVRAEIWITGGGAAVLTGSENNVTSTTGQTNTYTFDYSAVTGANADGSNIEARIVGTQSGGGPTVRASVDMGYIAWTVDYAVGGGGGGTAFVADASQPAIQLLGFSSTTATFTGRTFTTGKAIVAVYCDDREPTGVTVDGNAMTKAVESGAGAGQARIYYRDNVSAGTYNVVVTTADAMDEVGILVGTFEGVADGAPFDTAIKAAGGGVANPQLASSELTAPAGLLFGITFGTTNITWNTGTEVAEVSDATPNLVLSLAELETSATPSFDGASFNWSAIAAAAWEAAAGAPSAEPADATHGHIADPASITAKAVAAPADAVHAHSAEQPTATTQVVAEPADANHAHIADSPVIAAKAVAAPADSVHAHSADTPTTGTGGYTGTWFPDQLTSLAGWFDADDESTITKDGSNNVSAWNDKSGNAHHFDTVSGTSPVYSATALSGKPAIVFAGDGALTQASFENELGIAAVVRPSSTGGGSGYRGIVQTSDQGASGTGGSKMYSNLGTDDKWGTWESSNKPAGSQLQADTNYVLVMDAPTSGAFYRDGSADGTYSATTGGGSVNVGGSATERFSGAVAEIVWYDAGLSTEDRQKLEGYLAWKWGLEGSLPAGHPYEFEPPTFGAEPADSAHAHTADPAAITAKAVAAPAGAVHAYTADQPSATAHAVASPADSVHAHTAGVSSVGFIPLAQPQDAAHGHSSDQPTATAHATATPESALHGHSADQSVITAHADVTPEDSVHGHAADASTVTASAAPQDTVHAHSAEPAAITAHAVASPESAVHAHSADQSNVAFTGAVAAQPEDSVHGHTAGPSTITAHGVAAPADSVHSHSSDAANIVPKAVGAPSDAFHAQTAGSATVTAFVAVAPENAAHGHISAPSMATAHAAAAPEGAVHGHTAEESEVTGLAPGAVNPEDSRHAHTADAVTITAHAVVAPEDSSHGYISAEAIIAARAVAGPESAVHGHSADSSAVTATAAAAPVDAVHGQTADPATATAHAAVTPESAVHSHTSDSATIIAIAPLVEPEDAIHGHTASAPIIVAHALASPEDAIHAHISGAPVMQGVVLPTPAARHITGRLHNRTAQSRAFDRHAAGTLPRRSAQSGTPPRHIQGRQTSRSA